MKKKRQHLVPNTLKTIQDKAQENHKKAIDINEATTPAPDQVMDNIDHECANCECRGQCCGQLSFVPTHILARTSSSEGDKGDEEAEDTDMSDDDDDEAVPEDEDDDEIIYVKWKHGNYSRWYRCKLLTGRRQVICCDDSVLYDFDNSKDEWKTEAAYQKEGTPALSNFLR